MKYQDIKKIKEELKLKMKRLKKPTIAVKIYETNEEGYDEYCVEIFLNENGVYHDCWMSDIYTEEKGAKKRAKAILKMVKGWVYLSQQNLIENEIEQYHT